MTKKLMDEFPNNVMLQVTMNKISKGEKRRSPQEWAMIVAKHTGDLMEAVMHKDINKINKEVFHIAAPLLELYQEVFKDNEKDESTLEFPPDCIDPWEYARKLPGGIKEIDIDETMSEEIRHLLFEYQDRVYKLCNLKGSQPVRHKVYKAADLRA